MAKISDRRWGEISESDYSDADEYCRASVIHLHGGKDGPTKDSCKLPVREPRSLGGALNRNAVHAAANHLVGGRGGVDAPAEEKRRAARELVGLYRTIGEDPPESLRRLA